MSSLLFIAILGGSWQPRSCKVFTGGAANYSVASFWPSTPSSLHMCLLCWFWWYLSSFSLSCFLGLLSGSCDITGKGPAHEVCPVCCPPPAPCSQAMPEVLGICWDKAQMALPSLCRRPLCPWFMCLTDNYFPNDSLSFRARIWTCKFPVFLYESSTCPPEKVSDLVASGTCTDGVCWVLLLGQGQPQTSSF